MRDYLQLWINGKGVQVRGDDAFITLADFLRKRRGLIGTKVVCAEGDCGSCSVMLGRLETARLNYSAVCSCIQFMLQLDGSHIITVEGLRDGAELNSIQQSMVKCQGTQCGFCTPGFVVSLYDLMKDGKRCDAESVTRGLVGNLCRCTGYDSIVKAALDVEPASVKAVDDLYPPGKLLVEVQAAAAEEVCIEAGTRKFFKPTTIEAAVTFRLANPACTIISGGTDLCVVSNKRVWEVKTAMAVGSLLSRDIVAKYGYLHVGGAATLSSLERAALDHLPEFGRYLSSFGSSLIKNAGTLAGNLVTGSPIGDTLPVLNVLEADVELTGANGSRTVPISQFYTGYRKTVLAADELVTGVRIPLLNDGESLKLYKVSRRVDLDISSFSASIWMERTGDVIDDIRIAYGGVGPMVMRMTAAEDLLRGKVPTAELFEEAGRLAGKAVTPISDVRGSEKYRRALAANILLKFWHELDEDGGDDSAVPTHPMGAPALVRSPEGKA